MIHITFPDGRKVEFETGSSALDVAGSIPKAFEIEVLEVSSF